MLIGGAFGYRLLKRFTPRESAGGGEPKSHLVQAFGPEIYDHIHGKVVIDFGCGQGAESVDMAAHARGVVGLDIQDKWLDTAHALALKKGVAGKCAFARSTDMKADIVISKDAFEHFLDPGAILRKMAAMLNPDGYVLASFGPTWLHPYGGHLFSVFPWAHLLFTERALIRWRSEFKSDAATRFSEVDGGLNQITIRQFESFVASSPLRIEWLDTVPIHGLTILKSRWLREIGSSIVRAKLVPKVPMRDDERENLPSVKAASGVNPV